MIPEEITGNTAVWFGVRFANDKKLTDKIKKQSKMIEHRIASVSLTAYFILTLVSSPLFD